MEIQIISGFLGAGKTTFLNQYLTSLSGRTVVIENEFGSVGLDGALIRGDVPVRELSSGCICCTLKTDFCQAIREIAERYQPDRILIEPSGVGHLSDIIAACEKAKLDGVDLTITHRIVIVDIAGLEEYLDAFGNFYTDQIAHATLLLLSCIDEIPLEGKARGIRRIREINPQAVLYEDDWRNLERTDLLDLLGISLAQSDPSSLPCDKSAAQSERTFSSITIEHTAQMTREDIERILHILRSGELGEILRAKGILPDKEGGYLHFDLTLSAEHYRKFEDCVCPEGRVILIGCNLNKPVLRSLFEKKKRIYANKPHRA